MNVGNPPVSAEPSSDSESNVIFSPGQAKFLYWANGLINIPKALTPITTYWGERNNHNYLKNPAERALKVYSDVITDIGRQTTTCTFQLISYFVGGNIIQAILSKVYPAKEDDPQSLAKHQLILQISSLFIQVSATILSRRFGAAQLSRVFAQKEMPSNDVAETTIQKIANAWINKNLREPVTHILKPAKAALVGTAGIAAYLGCLVGVLYGLSTLLETLFPDTYKPKKSTSPKKESMEKKAHPSNVYSSGIRPFTIVKPWPSNVAPAPHAASYYNRYNSNAMAYPTPFPAG